MAKKNKKIKDPNKKSKAPFILLPISMVTAGVAKIVTIIIGAIGFGLFAWLYYDYGFINAFHLFICWNMGIYAFI